jgi:hypothetical protein
LAADRKSSCQDHSRSINATDPTAELEAARDMNRELTRTLNQGRIDPT